MFRFTWTRTTRYGNVLRGKHRNPSPCLLSSSTNRMSDTYFIYSLFWKYYCYSQLFSTAWGTFYSGSLDTTVEGCIKACINHSKRWWIQVVCFTIWNKPSDICLSLVKILFSHFSFNLSSQLLEQAWQELWQRNTDKISIKYDWIKTEMKEWRCTLWSIYLNVKGTSLPLLSLKLF